MMSVQRTKRGLSETGPFPLALHAESAHPGAPGADGLRQILVAADSPPGGYGIAMPAAFIVLCRSLSALSCELRRSSGIDQTKSESAVCAWHPRQLRSI